MLLPLISVVPGSTPLLTFFDNPPLTGGNKGSAGSVDSTLFPFLSVCSNLAVFNTGLVSSLFKSYVVCISQVSCLPLILDNSCASVIVNLTRVPKLFFSCVNVPFTGWPSTNTVNESRVKRGSNWSLNTTSCNSLSTIFIVPL